MNLDAVEAGKPASAIRIRQMPSQDRGPRRPRTGGSRPGAPRSANPRTGKPRSAGTGTGRPRRDDSRPSRSRDDRPSSGRPVRAAHGGTAIVRHAVVTTVQVLVDHIGGATTDPLRVDQLRVVQALVARFVIVTIDRRAAEMTDQVPVGQVPDARFAVGTTDRVEVATIAATDHHVRKPLHSVKPMKSTTAPVVASTAKSRCRSPNTPSSVGETMVR